MKKLLLFAWLLMLSIVATAQTIIVVDKGGKRVSYDPKNVISVDFQTTPPGFTVRQATSSDLYLFDKVKSLAPLAKTVYRVSDDIRSLGSTPPCLVDHERRIFGRFDTVSVPSSVMQ